MDCIIVLSCDIKKDGSIGDETKLRTDKGIDLFKKEKAKYVIFSGKSSVLSSHNLKTTLAKSMQIYAIKKGISKSKILLEEESLDTIGNAFFTKENILKKMNLKNLIVVTSDYHMSRTKYIFNKILGKQFRLKFVEVKSERNVIQKKNEEKAMLRITKDIIDNAKTEKEIKKAVLNDHPAYSKNPKYNIDELVFMMKKMLN